MKDAWSFSPEALGGVALRTLIVYVALVVAVRLAGKRQIAQLTPFDLVVLLLLSNAVQNAMTGPDTTVAGGLVAAATLLIANRIVSVARRQWPGFRTYVEGVPVVLVSHGQTNFPALQHEQMTEEELLAALREHEAQRIEDVELATLEIDGEVSVIRRDSAQPEKVHFSRKKLVRHHKKHG